MTAGVGVIPDWMRATVRIRRVALPVGRTIRAGLCVGLPVVVGVAVDHEVVGITIGLAAVLRTIGEHPGPHRANVRSLLVATPIAGCGYLFGLVQGWPLVALVALTAVVAFVAGTLAIHGPAFALGGMQFLLVSSLALGLPDTGTAEEIGWYLAGAAIYLGAMAVDFFLIEPRRPERVALADLDAAVLAVQDHPGPVQRSAANAALAAARRIPSPGWSASASGIARWGAYADVVAAADDLVAWEGANQGPDVERRRAYDEARTAWTEGRPSTRTPEPVVVEPKAPWAERLVPDDAALRHASRLALCFALAVSARGWVGLDHWYWVPATVGLVMQPDFGSVFGRATLRVVGTVAGSALAAVLLWVVPEGVALAVVIGLAAATIPWAKETSYVLQSVSLATVILMLVTQIAPAEGSLGLPAQRALATAVGGAIVLVFGYLIWPRARRVAIAPTVGAATAAIASLMRTASEPVPTEPSARADRKASAVGARQRALDLLAATAVPLGRAAAEPPPASTDAAAWSDAVHSIEHLATTVSDHAIARLADAAPIPDAAAVADDIEHLADPDDPLATEARADELAARIAEG